MGKDPRSAPPNNSSRRIRVDRTLSSPALEEEEEYASTPVVPNFVLELAFRPTP
jgi:hypothetical protein